MGRGRSGTRRARAARRPAARRCVDRRGRRRGQPAGRRRGERRRHRARSRPGRAGRVLLQRLRVRRAQADAVRRERRARAGVGLRAHEAARRGRRRRWSVDRPLLLALRRHRPQLPADDAAIGRRARRGIRRGRSGRVPHLRWPPGGRDLGAARPRAGDLARRRLGRVHLEGVRRGDLRGGAHLLRRAGDHDGRARPARSASRVLGAAQRACGRDRAAALARRPPRLPGSPRPVSVLAFADVSVRIERATILAGVSWHVGAGEHWALLGPNGAGKSTLLSLAAAARHPTSGVVEVLGARLGRTDVRALRRRIGIVDARTDRLVPPALDVTTVLLTGASGTRLPQWERYDDVVRGRATELVVLVGCAALAQRRYGTLSQGERQRVLLARALMAVPELLLLDEPAVGLDLPAREALLLALTAAAGERPDLATVCATHHVEELPPTTTDALLLRGGRVPASGSAEAVIASEPLSACFGMPIAVDRRAGRFTARADASWLG